MKRIFLAIPALALAAALTACAAAPDTLTAETPAPTPTAPARLYGSGDARMMSDAADGIRYEVLSDWELTRSYETGRTLVYAIDEAAGTARPACNVQGCTHDGDACPAAVNNVVPLADGDELYLFATDTGENWWLESFDATRTQRRKLTENFPVGMFFLNVAAADDENIYWTNCTDITYSGVMDQVVYAANKTSGVVSEIYRWHDLPAGLYALSSEQEGSHELVYYSLAGAQGDKLYFTRSENDHESAVTARVVFGVLDLTDGSYTDLQTYENEGRQAFDTPDGRHIVQYDRRYWSIGDAYSAAPGYLEDCDTKNGEAAVIDLLTGTRTVLASGLPTDEPGKQVEYSIRRRGDTWLLLVGQYERDENYIGTGNGSYDVYYCADGTATPLPQQRYCSARGTQPIDLMDIRDGTVLAAYDYWSAVFTAVDKTGVSYPQDQTGNIYGTMPLADLLEGKADFTPIEFTE